MTELLARGDFGKQEVVVALSSNQGDLEYAFEELTKSDAAPFQINVWGLGSGNDNGDGVRREDDSDEDYKLAPDKFSVFSTPVDVKKLGFMGKINQRRNNFKKKDEPFEFAAQNGRQRTSKVEDVLAFGPELESSDEEEIEDETITQWLIRDSHRPRVRVEVNEAKKLKSVEMIKAALKQAKDDRTAPVASGVQQKKQDVDKVQTKDSKIPAENKEEQKPQVESKTSAKMLDKHEYEPIDAPDEDDEERNKETKAGSGQKQKANKPEQEVCSSTSGL